MSKLRDRIKDAKAAIRDYVNGVRDAITGSVSLGTAFGDASDQQAEATEKLADALKTRREAYAALNQAKANNDAKAYGAALQDVATAEKAVNDAQETKPKDYTAIFREQIAAAKEFAGNITKLQGAGLGPLGLKQLLDLGPVAGNAVAKDLLAGTNGMTATSLETTLGDLAAAGVAAGMAAPGVSAALGATVGGTSSAPTIIVQAGVGDPVAIGKAVADVLNEYGGKVGGVPVITKSGKKSSAKKTPAKGQKAG